MDRFDRVFSLHKLIRSHRRPVPIQKIMDVIECSESTARRVINVLRDDLGAPLTYDRVHNGWFYRTGETGPYELPGLWFNPDELYALLVSYRLLAEVQPGVLSGHIEPLVRRVGQLLEHRNADSVEVARRIRILQMAKRPGNLHHFQQLAGALIQRKRVRALYHGREPNQTTERTVSPQRLVHYRSNWYLDAWCHLRKGLRSFSLDRLHPVEIQATAAREVSDQDLDAHYAGAYGIFAGPVNNTAVLRFSPGAARWVADEQWHPRQESKDFGDGALELRVPFGDPRELIKDILAYGPDVEVLAPATLRRQVAERLRDAAARY